MGREVQTLAEIALHELSGSRHAVKVGVQVITGGRGRHLLVAYLRVELVSAIVRTGFVGFLVDIELIDGQRS